MMNSFKAYLESYNIIHLIVDTNTLVSNATLISENKYELKILDQIVENGKKLVILKSDEKLNLRKDYHILINDLEMVPLYIGNITKTTEFDLNNYFDGWLGVKYTKTNVTFRLWAPLAKEVILVINDTHKYNMDYFDSGVYEIKLPNREEYLDKASYHYLIRNDFEFIKVIDPYCTNIDPTFTKSYIINLKKTYQFKHSFVDNINDKIDNAIIYETHVRDFTISLPLKHKGKFLGIVESKDIEKHGINYLKDLGITHVQLAPVNAFGGVDYTITDPFDKNFKYNWGYNPIYYNALCGWYSSNPLDPYQTINDFKQMIDELHQENIGVILDVVYNHVYITEEYVMNKIAPGYAYRYNANGELSNGSWCGNDIATERLMNRKFIIDSIKYYQDNFLIDGFRFDLMGLIDINTINEISKLLHKKNKNSLVYGEGWQMPTGVNSNTLSHMFNSKLTPSVGYFNDYFRNTLKGKYEQGTCGILLKEEHSKEVIESLFNPNKVISNYLQSINYVECHDNATFYDEQKKFGINDEEIKENAKLALVFVLFSKGISFIHSGQEILRTKLGIDNSYNSLDIINRFPWNLLVINEDLFEFTKRLIKIKKDENFASYNFSKVISKDKYIKVIFEKEDANLNIYLNLKKNISLVDVNKEIVLYGNKSKQMKKIPLQKGVIITKQII